MSFPTARIATTKPRGKPGALRGRLACEICGVGPTAIMVVSLRGTYAELRRTLPAIQAYRVARRMYAYRATHRIGAESYDRAVTALVIAKDGGEFRAGEALARFLWRGMTPRQQAGVVRMRAHCLVAMASSPGCEPLRGDRGT